MKRLAYTLAFFTSIGAVAFFVWQERKFTQPDQLACAHEALASDCYACHDDDRHVDVAKCAGCHVSPTTGAAIKFAGFARHHTYRDLNCLECHTDHHGAKASLTRADHGLEAIGCTPCHDRTMGKGAKYRLAGAKHPTETLHSTHLPWQGDCGTCHTEGGGISSPKCADCHDAKTGNAVRFTGFAGHHAYKDLDCLACHTAHRGRDGALLKPGKSFATAGCATCHKRHVGPTHVYALAGQKHPGSTVRKKHSAWQGACVACHTQPAGSTNCTTCHDPKTGKQVELKGFASHHFRKDLKCLTCHSEHRAAAGHPVTRASVTFSKVACNACHKPDKIMQAPLTKIPAAVRGSATSFSHDKHPAKTVSCATCHPMNPRGAHKLVGPYQQNCSSCHHGPARKKDSCATCHKKTADYFAARYEGKLVPRGTHGKSGEVKCASCHKFDARISTFKPPSSTCATCHPAAYTKIFLKTNDSWRQWRKTVDALPADHPNAQKLKFVARYWYHNDTQSAKVRKAHLASTKPGGN